MPLRLPTPDSAAVQDAHSFDMRDAATGSRAKPNMPRDFVSEQRVHQVLRARFGARPTANRGPGYIYWTTSGGVMFPLEDPLAVPGSKSIVRADGREQLFYSYGYVVSLLKRIDEAERVAREDEHMRRAAAAAERAAAANRSPAI